MRHIFIVLIVWTVAFILKVIIGEIGASKFEPVMKDEHSNLLMAILLMVFFILTELVPYLITLDMSFFKNFSIDDIKDVDQNNLIDIDE